MNRTIAVCTLIAWVALWVALTAAAPWTISDKNAFLAGFVNQEFLSFMGVVVTITLASAANLYIELNKLEEKVSGPVFRQTKQHVRDSAYALIGTLVAALVIVVLKPLVNCGATAQALCNGAALTIIIVSVMILIDLTQAAFALDPYGED